jgi:peptide deformylase
MTIRPILFIPDPRLRQVSEPVGTIDDGVRTLVEDMFETMYDAPGVGLAAPQIGVLKRVVVLDTEKDPEAEPKPIAMINPELVWVSDETRLHEEGCLSIPEFYEEVERPDRCRVKFTDLDGKMHELGCEDLLATAVQHEIDHLNGKLFIDHLSRLKREMITRKFVKQARRAG